MSITTLIVVGTMAVGFLVGACWNALLKFLNGWLRDTLEGLLGVENVGWYVSYIKWLDNQVTSKRATVLSWIKRFNNNVYSITEKYIPGSINGFFERIRETVVRTGATKGIKEVTTEKVADFELSSDILNEIERQNANIFIDVKKEVILKKTDEKLLTLKDAN